MVISEQVDDVVLGERDHDRRRLVRKMADMLEDARDINLVFAKNKNFVVGSSFAFAKDMVCELRKRGHTTFRAATPASDVGVDCAGGAKRRAKVQRKSVVKGRARLKAIDNLSRIDRSACKLDALAGVCASARRPVGVWSLGLGRGPPPPVLGV